VLDDGLETDMDLGTYERLLDQNLGRGNYVTSGQIFQKVLQKERAGGYLGRDVQMIPHVTGEVKYMVRDLAVKRDADVVFIEVARGRGPGQKPRRAGRQRKNRHVQQRAHRAGVLDARPGQHLHHP